MTWEKVNDARKSINTAQKVVIPREKSFSKARINYISHEASKTFFLDLMLGGGCFCSKI